MRNALKTAAIIGLTSLASQAQVHYIDSRPEKTAAISILADVVVTTPKLDMKVAQIYSTSGEGVTRQMFEAAAVDSFQGLVRDMIVAGTTAYLSGACVSAAIAEAAASGPLALLMLELQAIYFSEVVANHTLERGYVFVAPAEADYTLHVWVPGDWDKPCSMIKVFNTTNVNGNNVTSQVYNYDKTNASDRVETVRVHLKPGPVHIKVSVGSGTVLTHNAGHLRDARLDNATDVTWTVPGVPVNSRELSLPAYLPSVGATNSESITYNTASLPKKVTVDGVPMGSITYKNPRPFMAVMPLPQTGGTIIDIYGQPTEEEKAQFGRWVYTNMDAAELGTPSWNPATGVATFSFMRKPDVVTSWFVRARYHLTE